MIGTLYFFEVLASFKHGRIKINPQKKLKCLSLKVLSCKIYNNKYEITSTEITNTEIFAFIAVPVFKLMSYQLFSHVYKQKRQ